MSLFNEISNVLEGPVRMARNELPREDLFAEISSYQSRWEFQLPMQSRCLVAGIRDDGRIALFLNDDPVFYFNGDNQLLRAFAGGALYRTQGNTLARMIRNRTETVTELLRRDLDAPELNSFMQSVSAEIQSVQDQLNSGASELLRSSLPEQSSSSKLIDRLKRITETPIVLAPAYRTRRI
ncbi:hypothetical protein SH668x_002864 [Planctomicrobium sp. SH668]|uniref:hypothetical protein n=1 Tax=Planctomicrobium sp. SH668 TaxID=3448126 RepID=UPI003F5B6534